MNQPVFTKQRPQANVTRSCTYQV